MTLGDWDRDIESASYTDLVLRLQALNTLEQWPAFKEAFKGFGTFALRFTLQYEIEKRKKENHAA